MKTLREMFEELDRIEQLERAGEGSICLEDAPYTVGEAPKPERWVEPSLKSKKL